MMVPVAVVVSAGAGAVLVGLRLVDLVTSVRRGFITLPSDSVDQQVGNQLAQEEDLDTRSFCSARHKRSGQRQPRVSPTSSADGSTRPNSRGSSNPTMPDTTAADDLDAPLADHAAADQEGTR